MTDRPGRRCVLLVGGAGAVSSNRDIAGAALRQARRRGLCTQVINHRELLTLHPDVFLAADQTSPVNPDDPAACVRWVRDRVAAGSRFDVVLGLRDSVLPSVAAINAALGLPGNSPDSVRRSRYRDECRATLAAAGLVQPRLRRCAGEADAAAFVAEVPGPWVVKPRAGERGAGIRLVTEPAELPVALAGLPDPADFVVEEFVDGPEYGVEGVLVAGTPHVLAVVAKEAEVFVDVAATLPADPPPGMAAVVHRAVAALGLTHGPFHAELWHTPGGFVVGEVHARPGDDWTHLLLAHVRPDRELFAPVYDRCAPVAGSPARAAAARFLTPPPGRLQAVSGWDELVGHPAVLHAELTVRPGDMIPPLLGPADRSGVVLVGADTAAAARELAAELAGSVRFEVVPSSRPAGLALST